MASLCDIDSVITGILLFYAFGDGFGGHRYIETHQTSGHGKNNSSAAFSI